MLTQQYTDCYANWSQKYESIEGSNISDLFDKYITLYIIYNSLYSNIPQALIARGVHVRPNTHENVLATRFVTKLVEGNDLLSNLQANGCDSDINALIDILESEQFYINLYYGQRQRNEDLLILNKLRSTNQHQKAIGVLEVIYYVRCNLLHGHKNFVEPQRALLEPLINILSVINRQVYDILAQ